LIEILREKNSLFQVDGLFPVDTGTVTELAVLRANIQGLAPAGWVRFLKKLPAAVLGKTVVLEFRFASDFVPDADASGWYIDDVLVTTQP
jgi:hypothetical protein